MPDREGLCAPSGSPYFGATIALLTQHGKQHALAPFQETLAAELRVVRGFDTDTLGSFTREVPRLGTQLDAVRRKARAGLELSGCSVALASEGAFASGPMGIGTWNLELVVLVDAARGIEILGRSHAPGLHEQSMVSSWTELVEVARRAGFPAHALVLRPESDRDPRARKGVRSWDELACAYRQSLARSSTGGVFVESDLRAHVHPTRMRNIRAAALDLLARVACHCKACGAPGFGFFAKVPGLPCRDCGSATDEALADELRCVACGHREVRRLVTAGFADPFSCPSCNP